MPDSTDVQRIASLETSLRLLKEDIDRRMQAVESLAEDNRERVTIAEGKITHASADIERLATGILELGKSVSAQRDSITRVTASLATQKWLYMVITGMGSVIGWLLAHYHP